jgi:putative tryptophan/tyrosine transport system substrate-binding protein
MQRVVFLGPETAATDSRYRRFEQSLQRLDPQWRTIAQLEYAQISVSSREQTDGDLARALLRQPHVLLASNATCASAALRAKSAASIVFASSVDPVQAGMVRSHLAPGGRITGVSFFDGLEAKRLEMLRDAFPNARRVGVLVDKNWPQTDSFDLSVASPATALRFAIQPFPADTAEDVDSIMQGAEARQMDAWYVPRNYVSFLAEQKIIDHIRRLNVPAIHATEQEMAAGALMAYIQDTTFIYDALADLTLRILRGEDAGSIPIQRPKKFILAVRPRADPGTPQIDPSVIRRADRVY